MNTSEALRIAATRAAQDPTFLGHVLTIYREHERLSEDQLAEFLGTETVFLSRLYLCKRPDSATSNFAERVSAIADYVLIEAATLAGIIRQVDAIESLSARPQPSGLLAAARDKEEPDEPGPPKTAKD
jgi:hypothetical protein